MGPLIDLLPLPYTDSVVAVGAGLLGALAGLVGVFAVLRRRTLVADALSHAALPGVALAFLITGAKDTGSLLAGAAIAGLIGAVMIVGIERTSRVRSDAAIGVVLSGFFSLGIVLIAYIATTENANQAGLQDYLFGQAAGLLERDVNLFAVLSLAVALLIFLAYRPLKTTLFDQSFAASLGLPVRLLELAMTALLVIAIVVGLRTVGAIMMVALIVVPATAARQLTDRLGHLLPLAALFGAAVGIAGSLISTASRAPTGPVIVLVGFGLVLVLLALAPGRGWAWQLRRQRDARRAVLEQRELWTAWLEHGWKLKLEDAREADPTDMRGSLGDDKVEELLRLSRMEKT